MPGYKAKPERALFFDLEAFDWNCQQDITLCLPQPGAGRCPGHPVRQRIQELEAEKQGAAPVRQHR